jgi:hypothetical protein
MHPTGLTDNASESIGARGGLAFFEWRLLKDLARALQGPREPNPIDHILDSKL